MKKVFIKDDNGKEVEVDLKQFVRHINQYHKTGISIHDENTHSFTVDEQFRNKLNEMNHDDI
jgi:transcriptional regulator of NAD metabolism